MVCVLCILSAGSHQLPNFDHLQPVSTSIQREFTTEFNVRHLNDNYKELVPRL